MVEPDFLRFDTLSLHAGQHSDPATGARAVPIYFTTSYSFEDTDHAAGLFNLEIPGHIYSRISNPTVAVLEERVAALEGGVGAVATASGQAAFFLAVATLMDTGGHIVASRNIYGGTHNMLNLTLRRFGITTTFVDPRRPDDFAAAITPDTRLVFAETLGNPGIEVLDIAAVADVAHQHRLPLMVDATFSTPYLIRPFEHGADIVMHSATKFLGGHGVALGGVLVDGGHFDWDASGLFPTVTEPYAGYHGISFSDEFGPSAFISRARAEGLRDFGACMSPANAFQILQGVETLPLRMQRHVANTEAVAEALAANDAVAWVKYPSLPDHRRPRTGPHALPAGYRRHPELRYRRGTRRRSQVHRRGPSGVASGQRGRRQDAGHPPGQHHPPADVGRRPGRRRGGGGTGADLGRAGGPPRHRRGSGAGPQGLPALVRHLQKSRVSSVDIGHTSLPRFLRRWRR